MERPEHRILVIIPAYNEEKSIAGVISDVKHQMPEADIVVVNDGSSDGTSRIVREQARTTTGIKLLEHTFNMGIGATVQTGYMYALAGGYTVAVQVDGDGQHPASQIKKLVQPVINGKTDMAVGSRFLGHGDYRPSLFRRCGIGIFSGVVSAILRYSVTDPTSGFRAASRKAIIFLSTRYPDDYPEVESLVLLHKGGFAIMEVPVEMAVRQGGRSSITPGKSVYYMIKVLLAIFVDLLKK